MQDSLKGRVAWITGGSSGIGLAGAVELVKAGVHVVISGRNAATNAAALAQLQALGSVESVLMDVADKHAVKAVAQQILAAYGRIDILVNSAGINATKRNFDVLSTDSWDDVVNINLNGLFYCVHAVLPAMRAQADGLIVNVSSWAGLYASKLTGPAYNATKRAVLALSESAYVPPLCCPARSPHPSWRNARCLPPKKPASAWCNPRTWAAQFCFWPPCPRVLASTNW